MTNVIAILVTSKVHGQHLIRFDQEDFEVINTYRWHVQKGARTFYALARINGTKKSILMHRLLLPGDDFIDHIDGNGLNNCRLNIRRCTKHQNNMNCRLPKNNKSGYKGVSWDSSRGKYKACICVNYKTKCLGRFDSIIKAADVYNNAAIKYFGEFAKLNVI